MTDENQTIAALTRRRNNDKHLFTAGPASLLAENITGLRPCFGRGDEDYAGLASQVLTTLKSMSGHEYIVPMQGSGSLALEIMALNFLCGRVLILSSGYYSERLHDLALSAQRRMNEISDVTTMDWTAMADAAGKYDWVVACYTETSTGTLLPIEELRQLADRLGAKLMLDATASIGLETQHELADVISYSSCKGLFGLTGAAFIAYREAPTVIPDSFYLDLANHRDKKMTGPYHAIASLAHVLPRHEHFRTAVITNKQRFSERMTNYLTRPLERQPQLCTHVSCIITSPDPRAVLYASRSNQGGSVVCHLGEVHLGEQARGDILSDLEIQA
ncbi:MAG: aminotransferase class V-fold PLP-dependent enzyme [Halieaceae bacterium]|jgi:aspartate aminotransferase-like enzyme|nr:aminotransferase class V-fold PLP-dependent enzyme [Halieaceae bacterium]